MCKTLRFWGFSVFCQKPPQSVLQCLEIPLGEKMKCHHHLVLIYFYLTYSFFFARISPREAFPVYSASYQSHGRLADGDISPAHTKMSPSPKGGKAEDHHSLTQLAGVWINEILSSPSTPACLEQCCGVFSLGFADDGPSFTQEKCCPSPGEASPSPHSSLGSPSWILEQDPWQEPGRWRLGQPHPLCSSIHRSHCRSAHLAFTTCPAKFVSGGLNFRFVWPRNSQFCCMCSSVSPSPPRLSLGCETAQGDSLYAPNPEATQL